MANSSALIAYMASKDAQTSLEVIIGLLVNQEKLEISGKKMAHLLRGVLTDIDGAVDELENMQ